jgi:hypothetical protein
MGLLLLACLTLAAASTPTFLDPSNPSFKAVEAILRRGNPSRLLELGCSFGLFPSLAPPSAVVDAFCVSADSFRATLARALISNRTVRVSPYLPSSSPPSDDFNCHPLPSRVVCRRREPPRLPACWLPFGVSSRPNEVTFRLEEPPPADFVVSVASPLDFLQAFGPSLRFAPPSLIALPYDPQTASFEPSSERLLARLFDAGRAVRIFATPLMPRAEGAFKFCPPQVFALAAGEDFLRGLDAGGVDLRAGELFHRPLKSLLFSAAPMAEIFALRPEVTFRKIVEEVPLERRANPTHPYVLTPPSEFALARERIAQSQRRCKRAVIFNFLHPQLQGHGSQLGAVAVALNAALTTNRCLFVNDSSPWAFHGSHKFWGRYFEKPSDVDASNMVPPAATLRDHAAAFVAVRDDIDLPSFRLAPPEGMPRFASLLEWYGVIQTYLFRPSPYLKTKIEEFKGVENCVGVHLRRGHKWVEIDFPSLQAFVRAAEELAAAAAADCAFVVSDSDAAAHAFGTAVRLRVVEGAKRIRRDETRVSIPLAIRFECRGGGG